MTKNFKLTTDEELQAAREMEVTNKEIRKRLEMMHAQYMREVDATMGEYRRRMRDLFRVATRNHLPDPDEAFSKNSHFVNYAFLEHGDVFVCEVNPTDDGITATDAEPVDVTPPRKIVLN
jgi:hypothetical protein